MPNEHSNLIGLLKYSRLAEWIMTRPQIQEEAISQLAALLMKLVKPDCLAVVMEADHFCMHWRGVKDNTSKMTNSVMRGSFFRNAALRREFLALINLKAIRELDDGTRECRNYQSRTVAEILRKSRIRSIHYLGARHDGTSRRTCCHGYYS